MSARYVLKANVSALAERLQDDSLYGLHNARKYNEIHSDMTDIWVRYNHIDNLGEHFNDEHESVWYPVAFEIPELWDIVFSLMGAVCGERLGGVLITKLKPGGKILPHMDEGWHAGYYEKFFIPIQNDKGAIFCWEDMTIEPEPGEVWQFNNNVKHWVENNSERDRIAMIVCIRTAERSIREIRSMA
jgi:hypothetical protein